MNWPDDFCTSLSTSSSEGQEEGRCVREGCQFLISWNLDCKNIRMSTSGWYLSSRTNRVVNELKSFASNASRMCCSGRLARMKENGMECLLIEFVSTLRIYRCDLGSPHSSSPSNTITFGLWFMKSTPQLEAAASRGSTTRASIWASSDRVSMEGLLYRALPTCSRISGIDTISWSTIVVMRKVFLFLSLTLRGNFFDDTIRLLSALLLIFQLLPVHTTTKT